MSLQDHESTLEQLAQEGARLLTVNPKAAGERFEQAHDLALELGDGPRAGALSALVARSWHLRGSPAQCIRFARRAVKEAPATAGAHYTLGHFCEKAAIASSRRGRGRRAVTLFLSARAAFDAAAALGGELNRDNMMRAAEDCARMAAQLLIVR
jgi:hypothetical protein